MTRRTGLKPFLVAAAASALLWGSCDAEAPQKASPSPQASDERATTAATPAPAADSTPRVSVRDGSATLVASGTSRISLLREFARSGGFELDLRMLDPKPVHANLVDRPVAEVAGALAGSAPYALEYAVPAEGGRHRIARLRVGAASTARTSAGAEAIAEAVAPAPQPSPSETFDPRTLEPEWTQRINEIRRDLGTSSDSERVEFVEQLDTEGADFEVLADLLLNDPAPEVRIAAAESLGGAGNFGAVEKLLAALDDSNPDVLVAVLEGLAFSGDATLVSRLGALTTHNDAAVRAAAEEAIESLE